MSTRLAQKRAARAAREQLVRRRRSRRRAWTSVGAVLALLVAGTVDVYLDYLCPACRAFEKDAGQTIARYVAERRITVVYHPVAILDRYSTNQYSTRAAAGAGCAADTGRFTEYTAALYDRQPAEGGPGHSDHDLTELVAAAGIPREQFGQCLREGRYTDWVTHVTAEMDRRGVTGTPTVFVDGIKLANPTAQTLSAAIGKA